MELRYANTLYKLDVYHQHTFLHTFLIQKIGMRKQWVNQYVGKTHKGHSIVLLRIRKVEAQLLQRKPLTLHFIFPWDVISIRKGIHRQFL